jgi:hypothetical protein
MSAGYRLHSQIIRAETGDVLKQSAGCNQFTTTTTGYAQLQPVAQDWGTSDNGHSVNFVAAITRCHCTRSPPLRRRRDGGDARAIAGAVLFGVCPRLCASQLLCAGRPYRPKKFGIIISNRTTLGKIEDPKLRASLGRVYQAIVTRPWPTLPALAPAPVGPSSSTVGPEPHSRFSAVQRAVPGRKPHLIAVRLPEEYAKIWHMCDICANSQGKPAS